MVYIWVICWKFMDTRYYNDFSKSSEMKWLIQLWQVLLHIVYYVPIYKIHNAPLCKHITNEIHIHNTDRLHAKLYHQKLDIYTLWVNKKQATIILPITSPIVNWSSKFFHFRFSSEFATKPLLIIPPHLNWVTILPCAISDFKKLPCSRPESMKQAVMQNSATQKLLKFLSHFTII